jgi:hypothetical protein
VGITWVPQGTLRPFQRPILLPQAHGPKSEKDGDQAVAEVLRVGQRNGEGLVPVPCPGCCLCSLDRAHPWWPLSSPGKEGRGWRMQLRLSQEPREAVTQEQWAWGTTWTTAKSTFAHIPIVVLSFKYTLDLQSETHMAGGWGSWDKGPPESHLGINAGSRVEGDGSGSLIHCTPGYAQR